MVEVVVAGTTTLVVVLSSELDGDVDASLISDVVDTASFPPHPTATTARTTPTTTRQDTVTTFLSSEGSPISMVQGVYVPRRYPVLPESEPTRNNPSPAAPFLTIVKSA